MLVVLPLHPLFTWTKWWGRAALSSAIGAGGGADEPPLPPGGLTTAGHGWY